MTAETFAKWKQTRQDKKLAEQEAIKAAKDAKAAAGKNVGMSGRDLVNGSTTESLSAYLITIVSHSSPTTQIGLSKKEQMKMMTLIMRVTGRNSSSGKKNLQCSSPVMTIAAIVTIIMKGVLLAQAMGMEGIDKNNNLRVTLYPVQ